ncbi:MARC1 [Branchiostoma lanceolatum]|uniref:MARC1 protein n=1 Tax=Branchiostoma lanceolatum TaxID=7740 RepID=A0A8J9ZW72_BRALA|nr:MARC1 [Branchiostoma lanceolatum]
MDDMKATLQSRQVVVAAVATAAVVGAGIAYMRWRRPRREYVPVGRVSKIYVHSVKACRGLEVGEAEVTKLGVRSGGVLDRDLIILDETGRFVTARTEPRIVLISPQCAGDGQVRLAAPGMDPYTVPKPDVSGEVMEISMKDGMIGHALDCGPLAGQWLDKFFGKQGYSMVMAKPGGQKRHPVNSRRYKEVARADDKVGFQDYTPLNMASATSLEDLNSRLPSPVDMRVFRPNIVVHGSNPYQEDDWNYIRIGQAELRRMLPCNRCKVTMVDPETAAKDEEEPLNTLRSYRLPKEEMHKALFGQSPLFGVTLGVEHEGVINVGDTIYACG